MFVTTSEFEEHVPEPLRVPDQRFWQAVLLSSETPWFLVTLRPQFDSVELTQTVAVSWESALLSLVQNATAGAVISVARLNRDPLRDGSWLLSELIEMWAPASGEVRQTGPLSLGWRNRASELFRRPRFSIAAKSEAPISERALSTRERRQTSVTDSPPLAGRSTTRLTNRTAWA